jgi:hypothetical protein
MIVFEISIRTDHVYLLFNADTEILTNGVSTIKEWPMFTFGYTYQATLSAHDVVRYTLYPDSTSPTQVRVAYIKAPRPWMRKAEELLKKIGFKSWSPRTHDVAGPLVPRTSGPTGKGSKPNP